ncbi:hypothetical protein [Bacillus cereus group sp. BY128LC]|uniref:hypothetical protein n=1 Tax=Bacillus cereus group sp. BY128LC TaxID=3018084 RepID=UPI0022DFCC5F|nr:hypothetical protein [Bacillus cereus group sp. BY128LC]MDA1866746.1 hypothetical protein [Bacillus cereus group sp. BY128LC]
MKILEEVKLSSVIDCFKTDFDYLFNALKEEDSFYFFDNDFISSLRLLDEEDLVCVIDSLDKSNIVLIPEPILEESCGNNWMTPELYKSYYHNFFNLLSERKEIHIVSFETLYELILKSTGNESESLRILKMLAIEATRGYGMITDNLKTIPLKKEGFFEILEDSMKIKDKNGGERFLSLANLVFIHELFGPGYVCSNDKQTYTDRCLHSKNEMLLEMLDLDFKEFRGIYQTISFVKVLEIVIQKKSFSEHEAFDFLKRCRKDISRNIKAIVYGEWFHDSLENEKFVELVLKNEIKIAF